MAHKYLVDLTETEQTYLLKLIQKGKPSARKVARAQVLLHAAEGATDDAIATSSPRRCLNRASDPPAVC